MEKDELIRQRQANFRQTNAYAMQNGIIVGLWAVVCQACFVAGLTRPAFSTLWMLMLVSIPVVVWLLTLRFRKIVGLDVNFTFSHGFMHAFLTLMYAAVWAGVATFVYLQFFDNGYIFDCYAKNFSDPATVKMMTDTGLMDQIKEATGGESPVDLINEMRNVGAGNYAAIIIYGYMLVSPVIAVVVGLLSIHRVHYRNA